MIRRASLAAVAVTAAGLLVCLLARTATAQETTTPPDGTSDPATLPPSLLFGIFLTMVPLVAALFVLYRYRRAMH